MVEGVKGELGVHDGNLRPDLEGIHGRQLAHVDGRRPPRFDHEGGQVDQVPDVRRTRRTQRDRAASPRVRDDHGIVVEAVQGFPDHRRVDVQGRRHGELRRHRPDAVGCEFGPNQVPARRAVPAAVHQYRSRHDRLPFARFLTSTELRLSEFIQKSSDDTTVCRRPAVGNEPARQGNQACHARPGLLGAGPRLERQLETAGRWGDSPDSFRKKCI